MLFIFKFTKKLSLFLYPAIIICLASFISSWCSISFINMYSIYFFISLTFIIYHLLYTALSLPQSSVSFIIFQLILLQISLYLFGIYNMFFFENPIYLNSLNSFSQYRYLLLFIISIIFGIFLLISYFANIELKSLRIPSVVSSLFKEEIRTILYYWDKNIWGPLCLKITMLIMEYPNYIRNRRIFIIFQLLCNYFCRCLIVIFLLNFCFFNGDLRLVIYCLPLSFFSWLCKQSFYYFYCFYEDNFNYMKQLINVVPKKPLQENIANQSDFNQLNSLYFKLTPFGSQEKYTTNDLPYLSYKWLKMSDLAAFLTIYEKKLVYFSYFLTFTQIFIWFSISYYFFIDTFLGIFSTNWLNLLLPKRFVTRYFSFTPSRILNSPLDSRIVVENAQYLLRQLSNGQYGIGHPVFGEIMPDGKEQITLAIKPNVKITNHEFIQYNNEYLILYPLENFLHSYYLLYDYYKPFFLFFINLSFFIGWFFIFVFNLFYFF